MPVLQTDNMLSVEVIRETATWDRIQPEWDALFHASPNASPPLHFDWLRQWWRIYGPVYAQQGRGLRILTVRRDERLIGVLPLYESCQRAILQTRRLQFLSTGEQEFEEICPDYLDLLCLPAERQTCLDAIGQCLLDQNQWHWDELILRDVSERSLLPEWWSRADGCRVRTTNRGVCPIANIAGGLDAYLARLSANTRQQSRRLLRMAQKAGAQFELASDPQQVDRFFADMVRLHQARWQAAGQPGCFAAPRFTEFHQALCRLWAPRNQALLARLSVAGETLAVLYGFAVNTKFDFYQSGVVHEETSPVRSPGIVAFLLLMEQLAQRGFEQFDFLRGESFYKQRLATEARLLVELRMARTSLRLTVRETSDWMRRAARKAGRMLQGAYVGRRSGC